MLRIHVCQPVEKPLSKVSGGGARALLVRAGLRLWMVGRRLVSGLSLGVVTAFVLGGCVTYVRPVGEWARPADLKLHSKSLEGVRVAVRCGSLDSQPDGSPLIREQAKTVCDALEGALEAIGAEIPEEGTASDLTLWYLDRSKGAESCSVLLASAHALSGYTVPCKSAEWSEGELRVSDARGTVLERAPLRVEKYTLQSWLFIPSSLWSGQRERERKRLLQSRFLQYAQNRVYSQSLRLASRAKSDGALEVKVEGGAESGSMSSPEGKAP